MMDYANQTDTVVNTVDTMSNTIANYGIMVVISSVMIVVFIIFILVFIGNANKSSRMALEQNNKFIQEIIDQNNELTEKLTELNKSNALMMKQSTEPYDKKNIVDIFLDLNNVLKGTCQEVQEAVHAGRVAVYVFHNGAVSSHGLPFFKMSCIAEWIKRGSGFVIRSHEQTNLPLSIFSKVVEDIHISTSTVTYTAESMKEEDPIYYSWMHGNNVNTCFIQGIYSGKDNTAMGYITIEFAVPVNPDVVLPIIEQELHEACLKCVPVLEFSNIQSLKTT